MFVLKDPAPTPAQLELKAKQAETALYNKCAEANHLPTIDDMVLTALPAHETAGKETTKPTTATTEAAKTMATLPAKEGPILTADQSVTVNLADGAYLKLGLAAQLPVGAIAKVAKEEGLMAKVTNDALQTLSMHTFAELVPPKERLKIREELSFDTCRETNAEIMSVLFTEFVMQKP